METIAQTPKKRAAFNLDAIYYEPNEATLEAIEEARSGRYAGTLDASSFEAFMKSIEAIEG